MHLEYSYFPRIPLYLVWISKVISIPLRLFGIKIFSHGVQREGSVVRALSDLPGHLGLIPRNHMVALNSSSRGSDAIFWLCGVAKHTCGAYIHVQAKYV